MQSIRIKAGRAVSGTASSSLVLATNLSSRTSIGNRPESLPAVSELGQELIYFLLGELQVHQRRVADLKVLGFDDELVSLLLNTDWAVDQRRDLVTIQDKQRKSQAELLRAVIDVRSRNRAIEVSLLGCALWNSSWLLPCMKRWTSWTLIRSGNRSFRLMIYCCRLCAVMQAR